MKKLNYIDALRGLAILGVILIHTSYYGETNLPTIIGHLVGEGSRGVQLFFLASAFTLFLSFKNRIDKEKKPVLNFFIRRFFRIAPMYYLGIFYYLYQDGFGPRYWLGDQPSITNANIVSNFTFTHGFNPYWTNSLVPGGWSIGVEMLFYALVPILYKKIKNINHAFNFLLLSIILKQFLEYFFLKFQLITDIGLWKNYMFFYFPSQLPIFCLGILLFFMVNEKESLRNISGKSILVFSFLLILQFGAKVQFFPNFIFFGFAFFILSYALSIYQFKLFVNPIINHIGKISFSMYLVHFAILFWLKQYNFLEFSNYGLLNFGVRFTLVTCLTVLLSSFFYYTIELKFQDLGKKIINKLTSTK